MSVRRRRQMHHESIDTDASFEIDLAPMLALMVTLIPVMLLSTVFVRITLIETPLPQVIQNAMQEDQKKKERQVDVMLEMNTNSLVFKVKVDGRVVNTSRLPNVNNRYDLKGLYRAAYSAKMSHPKVFRLDLVPSRDVSYEDIVKVMDEVRNIKSGDKQATVTDSKTLQKAQTKIMFPDVNFANVVEG